jgi:hypothetical protein
MFSLCLGCAGKNTVAGADKPKAEQLEEAVPSWCERICERMNACASGGACDCSGDVCTCNGGGDCVSDCHHEMQRYTGGDDECATVGQRFSSCLDGLTCEQLDHGKQLCRLSEAEDRHCPYHYDDPPVGDDGPSSGTGGATGSAGSAASGGVPSGSAGTGSGGASGGAGNGGVTSVSCDEGYGVGAAGSSPGGSPSSLTCEEGRESCSDAHDYSWVCVQGSQGQLGCTCFVDSQVTGGFDPATATCPSLATVNAGCGWNIIE